MSVQRKEAPPTDSQRPSDALAKAIEEVVGDATRGALVEASAPVKLIPEAVRRAVTESFEAHNVRLIPGELVELRDRLEVTAERLEKHVAAQSADERVAIAGLLDKHTLAVSQELSRAVVGLTQALSSVNQRFSQAEAALLEKLSSVSEQHAALEKKETELAAQIELKLDQVERSIAQAASKHGDNTRQLGDQLQVAWAKSAEAGWARSAEAAASDRRAALEERTRPLTSSIADMKSRVDALATRLEMIAPRLEALEPKLEGGPQAMRALEERLAGEEGVRRQNAAELRALKSLMIALVIAVGLIGLGVAALAIAFL